jgi:hypothetical protein
MSRNAYQRSHRDGGAIGSASRFMPVADAHRFVATGASRRYQAHARRARAERLL